MAFSDPQTLDTAAATSVAHPRISTAKPESLGKFISPDGKRELQIRQLTTKNRLRSEVVLFDRKIAADPLTAVNSEVSASVSIVFDRPRIGFTVAELEAIHNHLHNWFAAGTYASRKKVLGLEN